MAAYYNEIDPFAAAWLRELIKAGHIAPGEVDTRSIADVMPSDLTGFTQCHFFAGIGVWSYALRQAGWTDDRPVWTGSCPCQPFSSAGKGKGFKDERHLWPEFYRLISQCRPATCFGEQVASKDGLAWLDLVQADMEDADYAFGAVDTCAAGFGAPHIRQRLYWGANAIGSGQQGQSWCCGAQKQRVTECGVSCSVAHTDSLRCEQATSAEFCANSEYDAESYGGVVGLADSEHEQRQGGISGCAEKFGEDGCWSAGELTGCGKAIRLDNAERNGRRARGNNDFGHDWQQFNAARNACRPGPVNGHWRYADWLLCRDGKWRAVEPGTFPLVNGAAARVGRLRGYGNAINAIAAQTFIEAFMEVQNG